MTYSTHLYIAILSGRLPVDAASMPISPAISSSVPSSLAISWLVWLAFGMMAAVIWFMPEMLFPDAMASDFTGRNRVRQINPNQVGGGRQGRNLFYNPRLWCQ